MCFSTREEACSNVLRAPNDLFCLEEFIKGLFSITAWFKPSCMLEVHISWSKFPLTYAIKSLQLFGILGLVPIATAKQITTSSHQGCNKSEN